jgi:hypothetical protein
MFSFAYNQLEGAMVGVYRGEFEGDRDHQRLLDSLVLLDREDTGTRYRLYVLVTDPRIPRPNATWRRRFAEFKDATCNPTLFAFVSPSALLRGVITTVNWVTPATVKVQTSAHATFPDASRWLEERCDRRLPFLDSLYKKALAGE